MNSKLVALLMFMVLPTPLFSQTNTTNKTVKPLSELQKIDYLINSIEQLQGAKFYRNGAWHNAEAAASHLRMKLSKAGNRIKTAKDFIDKIASASSITGEAYKIKFADGKVISTRDYFNSKLKELQNE